MSEQPTQPQYDHRPVTGTRFDNDTVLDLKMAREGLISQPAIEAQRQVEALYAADQPERGDMISPVAEAHLQLTDLIRHRQDMLTGQK